MIMRPKQTLFSAQSKYFYNTDIDINIYDMKEFRLKEWEERCRWSDYVS